MKKIILATIAAVFLISCEEVAIPGKPYDGPDYVFYTEQNVNLGHKWMFYTTDAEMPTAGMKITTVGGVYDHDRRYKYELKPTVNKMMQANGRYEHVNVGNLQLPPESLYRVGDPVVLAGDTTALMNFTFLRDHSTIGANRGMYWEFEIVLVDGEDFEVWQTGNIDHWGKTACTIMIEVDRMYNLN